MTLTDSVIRLAESGNLPDAVLRFGIRRLLVKRLRDISSGNCETQQDWKNELIQRFTNGPIALVPEKANEQHYEVGADVFLQTLGKRLKYSCCYWPKGVISLDEAEERALEMTCARAEISDSMRVLELGCGWGSLTLWMAEKFPNAKITAVSNSSSQRDYILKEARRRGIGDQLRVDTCDMNDFTTDESFDRVVSIEMFEHMRNYDQLLSRISNWLAENGKLFVHIFCHRQFTYEFVDRSSSDWMSRYFFTGGIMPSDEFLLRFPKHLAIENQWRWSGCHYRKTADAWLSNMDRNRDSLLNVMREQYGADEAIQWFHRWRLFYLACSELFGFKNGNEWWVSHYLFSKHAMVSKSPGTSKLAMV